MSRQLAKLFSCSGLACLMIAGCSREKGPSIAEGQSLYAENGCGSCHGASGSGDGPVAPSLDPAPTDLHRGSTFKTVFDEASIAQMLATGIASHNHPPGVTPGERHNQGMPPFNHLSEHERRSLALYVMSLNTDAKP